MVPFFLWAFGGRRRRQLMLAADSDVAIGATLESAFLLGQWEDLDLGHMIILNHQQTQTWRLSEKFNKFLCLFSDIFIYSRRVTY
jgi:hypothetical protein